MLIHVDDTFSLRLSLSYHQTRNVDTVLAQRLHLVFAGVFDVDDISYISNTI